MKDFPEKDWKYLRSIQPELLEELSRRINEEIRIFLSAPDVSENDKRGQVYKLVKERDKAVAECFDDMRRSRALERCRMMYYHRLLTQEHLQNFTDETRQCITWS